MKHVFLIIALGIALGFISISCTRAWEYKTLSVKGFNDTKTGDFLPNIFNLSDEKLNK